MQILWVVVEFAKGPDRLIVGTFGPFKTLGAAWSYEAKRQRETGNRCETAPLFPITQESFNFAG